ncbi:MAG: hypothetical protein J0I79_21600 [Mesorhizobium sp.]|uniref:hypothetical protein n=1 Tax=Mesorhizobium sp. TaxID=1871066 RepID=UPI001ACD7C8B|nr:hypothetical protein [Mesorhizobium sp.]MBN9220551.1 hypothetical protein [Mesorhizobium sp.]
MELDFQHLLTETPAPIRYRPGEAARVEALLARATGCVVGRQRGRFYVDIVINSVPHRVEFDRQADFDQACAVIRTRSIPVHRERDVMVALICTGAVLVLAIAIAMWLRP